MKDSAFEELLVPHLYLSPMVLVTGQLDQRSHDPCVACGCGDNSISHWSRFCVVPLLVFNYFSADTHTYANLAQSVNHGDSAIAVASVVLHQFRRLLLERGGMVPSQEARNLVTWIHKIGLTLWGNLFTMLSLHTCVIVHGIKSTPCQLAQMVNAENMLAYCSATILIRCISWL